MKLLPSLPDVLFCRADAVGQEDCEHLRGIALLVLLLESRVEQEHVQVGVASPLSLELNIVFLLLPVRAPVCHAQG